MAVHSMSSVPEILSALDAATINARIEDCLDSMYRLRMGGRTTAMTVLCILLWSVDKFCPTAITRSHRWGIYVIYGVLLLMWVLLGFVALSFLIYKVFLFVMGLL